jgi:uncharacterized MAPEG superfamily protein
MSAVIDNIKNNIHSLTGHVSGKAHDMVVNALPIVNFESHYPTVLVTIAFALSLNLFDAMSVGVGRSVFKVGYPGHAEQGPALLKHAARVHQNQLEQGLPFLAVLWCTSIYGPSANFAAFFGTLWMFTRLFYAFSYRHNATVNHRTLLKWTKLSSMCLMIMTFATIHTILTRQFFRGSGLEGFVATLGIALTTWALVAGNMFLLRSLYSGGKVAEMSDLVKEKAFAVKEGLEDKASAAKGYLQEKTTAVKESLQEPPSATRGTTVDSNSPIREDEETLGRPLWNRVIY